MLDSQHLAIKQLKNLKGVPLHHILIDSIIYRTYRPFDYTNKDKLSAIRQN
jgi:hypothetical protein